MNAQPTNLPPRILVIDDNAAIHNDFRKVLGAQDAAHTHLDDVEKELFGSSTRRLKRASFRIDSAFQGQEALAMVQRALQEKDPYMLAFVDVRMPPGWDGVETIERLWQCSPDLQAVLCTAYSDYSWDEIARRLGQADSLLILKKPFDTVEVLQLAHALTKKWMLAGHARLRLEDLDRMVGERTRELQEEIEERALVQKALGISEERFSKAFHANPLPMAIQTGTEGRFLDANASFFELTGYAVGQLLQHTGEELRLWGEGAPAQAGTGALENRIRNHPCQLRRQDGTTRHVLVWTEPILVNNEKCLLVLAEDVTERLKLEAQLRQSQKMEAVGCLCAGVAHEFNNLLTVILGHTDLLRGKPADARAAADSLDSIFLAGQRAASLTRHLLAFSRKQPLELKAVNLSAVVQNLQKMLGRLIGEHYRLRLSCAADLPATRADEGNLEQVVINLVLNARDAMPEGGTIEMGTSLVKLDEAAVRDNAQARPGEFVCLTVTDSGCGMTEEVLGRIFDPFFTTKEIGKGTGLGLSTVHGIIKQHRGWIEVASEVGRGSTFKIFLPVCATEPDGASPGENNSEAMLRGSGEAILLVEDEASVRSLARLALERGGYRVFEAADGPHALAVWERSAVRIDLLITDMVMPNGLTGGALARTLQMREPRLRTIFTSGYSSEIIKEDRRLIRGDNFLPKPYDSLSLLKVVKLSLRQTARKRG